MKRKTSKQYKQECINMGYDLPIEDYKGNRVRIKHKCKRGHIYEQTPNNHLHGNGCPICKGKKKKTSTQYFKECKDKGIDPPIEDYINATTKIKHKCSKNHIYKQQPCIHLRGVGCPVCKGTFKKTSEEYLQECKEKGYPLPIEDYVNNSTKIKHKCTKCGNIWEIRPSDILQGYGCPICGGTKKKITEEYIKECKEKV